MDIVLPSDNYTVEWESYLLSSTNCNIVVRLGKDSNNFVFAGITGNASYRLFTYQNGSYIEQLTSSQTHTGLIWVAQKVTVENTVVSYKENSATSNRTFTLDKLLTVITQNSKIRNIKIKPL